MNNHTSIPIPAVRSFEMAPNPNGLAPLNGSAYGPAFDGIPEDVPLVLNTDDGTSFRLSRFRGELAIFPKHRWHDPDFRLRKRDWSFSGLFEEVSATPWARVVEIDDFKLVADRENRLFVFTTPKVPFHPAVAAVICPTAPDAFPHLLPVLMIAVAGRWRFPAIASGPGDHPSTLES